MVDYLDMMHKIYDILRRSAVSFSSKIDNRDEQIKLLSSIFGEDWDKSVEISNMTLDENNDYSFLTYDSKKKNHTQNLVIIKDGKPLFKGEYTECWGYSDDANYEEIVNTIYREGTHRIENRIIEKKWKTDNVTTSNINISEITILNFRNNEYSRHNYTLYSIGGFIVSFKNHEQMWLKSESSFEHRLDVIKNNILKAENKIVDRVNYILSGENVKKYEIKRKKS